MTNIPIFFYRGKVCYLDAGSRRDQSANMLILLPSMRIVHPVKHYQMCYDIGDDVLGIKYYESNAGVPYLEIYDLREKKLIYSACREIFADAVYLILKKYGVDDKWDVVATLLGLE